MTGSWTSEALRARISDHARRTRYAGGSPDDVELGAYADALTDVPSSVAVVLGMTPELRALAASVFKRVIAIDISEDAIELYRDWLSPHDRRGEQIIHGDWLDIGTHVDGPFDAVLGDGVFGNLPDVAAHRRLLDRIAASLRGGGVLVVRQAVVPSDYRPARDAADALLGRHRRGELDADEFGFGMRLLGHRTCCYDEEQYLLENRRLFEEVAAQAARGELSPEEHAAIRRYHFDGPNCVLPEAVWEELLGAAGYTFRRSVLAGRDWYRYYPVYCCRLIRADRKPPRAAQYP